MELTNLIFLRSKKQWQDLKKDIEAHIRTQQYQGVIST